MLEVTKFCEKQKLKQAERAYESLKWGQHMIVLHRAISAGLIGRRTSE